MQGAAIFRCLLIVALPFYALCGAQRSSASLPTDGAERALDFSTITRYNSSTRTPRSRYHIIENTGKNPAKYKEITPNTTFVKFHRTVACILVRFPTNIKGTDTSDGVSVPLEQGTGIEPAFTAWEAVVLPIYEPCEHGVLYQTKMEISTVFCRVGE